MPRQRRVKANKKTIVRSKFEASLVKQLDELKAKYKYESLKIKYTVPEKVHTYTPDFVLANGIIVEAKGKLTSADRKKMMLVAQQNKQLDIRFVFMQDNKLSKVSKTKYSDWASKNGFQYAFKQIPESWLEEEMNDE